MMLLGTLGDYFVMNLTAKELQTVYFRRLTFSIGLQICCFGLEGAISNNCKYE